jgi:hypothetical protein
MHVEIHPGWCVSPQNRNQAISTAARRRIDDHQNTIAGSD